MHSMESILQILKIDLFLSQWYVVQYSFEMLGSGSEPQLPVSHTTMKIHNWYSAVYCIAKLWCLDLGYFWLMIGF